MSKDFYYDILTKDLTLTSLKDLRFTEDIVEYTTQKIEKVLSFLLGEWYLNTTEGVPYIAQKNNDRDDNTKNILVKNPNIPFINNIIKVKINDISTIDRVVSVESVFNTLLRSITVTFEAVLINSETLSDSLQIGIL